MAGCDHLTGFNGGPLLVTGATGFVGEHLARLLVAVGGAVTGLGHTRSVDYPGIALQRIDLRDAEAATRVVRDLKPRAVFHCAAATDAAWCQQHPDQARGHIVDATSHLAQAVREVDAETPLVALSTDLVFDGEHAPYSEQDAAQPLSAYGQLKLEAEAAVLGLPRGVVLRSALVYGKPATHKSSFLGWMVGTLSGGKPLTLFEDEVRCPIWVEDLCWAMVALAANGRGGLWHAGGPQRLSRVAIGRAVCEAFGFNPSLIQPTRLAESPYPAPRPRDVSLDSARLWGLLGRRPKAMGEALGPIAGDFAARAGNNTG